jgi:copper resistance protein C
MSQNLTLKIVVALAVVVSTSAAFSHAQLQKAAPAVGGKFSEVIEPRFSGIALATPAGVAQPLGKASVDPADNSTRIAPVPQPLKPGVYTVTWHAVSVDTHKTRGSFTFTVAP